jgi:hypothetical protein
MTLILAFLSSEYVILASDRRITWTSRGTVHRTEDTENKAIALCGHFLMGYTGFARLGNVKTDQWVVDRLVGVASPSDYFRVLRQEADSAIRAIAQPLGNKGHAFVAVGYTDVRGSSTGEKEAVGVTVSNATGGGYGAWSPREAFEIARTPPLAGPHDFRLQPFGSGIPPRAIIEEAVDLIRRYRKRDRSRAVGVLQVLVGLIRRVAGSNQGVSADVSVSVLPREAVPAQWVSLPFTGIGDPVEELTCIFVPANRGVESAISYGPATVCPGWATWGDEGWAGGHAPPWWRS